MGGCDRYYGGNNIPYKSWGEEQIARLLQREGITYQYEYPLALIDKGKIRIYYPDFRLPEQGIVIEYFGVNGEQQYDEKTQHKLRLYEQAGIEGLFLTRGSLRGDWPTKIMDQIENILKNRLYNFYNRQSYVRQK
jgi:DNA helicase-4